MIIRNDREKYFARQTPLARAAFTLMEILVVVAIIVALAGVGGYFLVGQLISSKADVARLQAKKLKEACTTYFIRNGSFPNTLQDLVQPPNGGIPVMEDPRSIIDPWGQPYQYQNLGTSVVIGSNLGGAGQITSND